MTDQVEEIKGKVEIVELIGERVNLKKAGRHYKGLCPFHSEKSPSFIVSPERQSYKCFGCGKGGDVYTFLQEYEGYSFLESLELLAQKTGVTLESYRPTQADSRKKRLLSAHNLAWEYYKFLLDKHQVGEGARAYLAKRGITKEAVNYFGLGYSPEQWRGVSDFLVGKKDFSQEELEAAGLVIRGERGYYDRFRGRVMFPLRDHKGAIVGFSGRTLSTNTDEAKYINSPETELYHKSRMLYGLWENREQIRKADSLILVEGELDVIPSWQAGVKNVAAIKGSAFTQEMGQLIKRYTTNVVYALDADQAGQEAVKKSVKVADPLDLSIRVVQIKDGKDPGDVATADPGLWREMAKGAVLYWDFLLASLCEQYDPSTGTGAAKISELAVPEIALITNQVLRARYVGALAKRLAVPEESIYNEIERLNKKQELSGLKTLVKKIEKGEAVISRRERLAERLLALALQFYPQLKAELPGSPVLAGAVGKVMEALKEFQGEWQIQRFAARLPAELSEAVDKTYLADLAGVDNPEKEWGKTRRELEEVSIRARLKELSQEIGEREQAGDEAGLKRAKEEFARQSRRLSEVSD